MRALRTRVREKGATVSPLLQRKLDGTAEDERGKKSDAAGVNFAGRIMPGRVFGVRERGVSVRNA